jgi:hypothetical protein
MLPFAPLVSNVRRCCQVSYMVVTSILCSFSKKILSRIFLIRPRMFWYSDYGGKTDVSLNCGRFYGPTVRPRMRMNERTIFFNFRKCGAHCGMILTGENRRTRGKTRPNATLSTTDPTGLTRRPATNRLSHGTAPLRSGIRLQTTRRALNSQYVPNSTRSGCVSVHCWDSIFHEGAGILLSYRGTHRRPSIKHILSTQRCHLSECFIPMQ